MRPVERNPPPALARWNYAIRLLNDETPFVLGRSPVQAGHVSNEPAFPWFTHEPRRPWRGYWTARAFVPNVAGHVSLTEVINTVASYPEPYEYQYHIHIPFSPQAPLGRNVRFCKDRKALRFGQLYHAHDYPAFGPQPRGPRSHLSFPPVCLRWALATALVLLDDPTVPLVELQELNDLRDFCPDSCA